MKGLSEKFNDLARPLKECDEDDPCNYFEFGFRYMRNLFQPNDHETISILPSVEDVLGQSIFYEKKMSSLSLGVNSRIVLETMSLVPKLTGLSRQTTCTHMNAGPLSFCVQLIFLTIRVRLMQSVT